MDTHNENENIWQEEDLQAPLPDDLLDWVPPELVERARITAEKEQKSETADGGKVKKANFSKPPAGKNKKLSLAMLIICSVCLVLGTVFSAVGSYASHTVLTRGRLWFALWIIGQAITLCIYALYLLPLEQPMRRPSLITLMGAGLAFNTTASLLVLSRQQMDAPTSVRAVSMALVTLMALLVTPSFWLFIGLLRKRSAEKRAAVLGSVAAAITFFGLISTITKGSTGSGGTPIYISVLYLLQSVSYLILLASWPVLSRPILSKQTEGAPAHDAHATD